VKADLHAGQTLVGTALVAPVAEALARLEAATERMLPQTSGLTAAIEARAPALMALEAEAF
jgi:hypothetical protein